MNPSRRYFLGRGAAVGAALGLGEWARSSRPAQAVRKGLAFGRRHPGSDVLRRSGGRLLPLKASWDPHDLKFPVAMFEKHAWVSREWRPHLTAATVLAYRGPDSDDNPVVYQVREALRKL